MTTHKTPNEIKSEIIEWLKETRYASTYLEALSGGKANFIYRARLSKALEDGTTDVVVKHGEAYMAKFPCNELTIGRCRIEEECLEELSQFRTDPGQSNTIKYVVRTPKCYLYDDVVHTQVQEYLHDGITLKAYALKNFPSPTPQSFQPQCHQLGKALAQWITGVHHKTGREIKDWSLGRRHEPQPNLYTELKANKEMQKLKHIINYDWLLERVDQFPKVLEEARGVFAKVKDEAMKELNGAPEDLTTIHGDFSSGNVLLPNRPIQEGAEIPVFVIDWENAQLGVPSLDHGEMIGELYALWLYRRIDAGLWMVQGYAEGLGEQTDASVWRIAVEVGCYLLSFSTIDSGWGAPDRVEEVARMGRELIVNAWGENRKWLDDNDLSCLFRK